MNKLKCSRCNSVYVAEDSIQCSKCNIECHYLCNGFSEKAFRKFSKENRENWKCYGCSKSMDGIKVNQNEGNLNVAVSNKSASGGDIKSTSSASPSDERSNQVVTVAYMEKLYQKLQESFSNSVSSLKAEVNNIGKKTDKLNKQFQDFGVTVTQIEKKVDLVFSRVDNMDVELEKLKTENFVLKNEIFSVQQYLRKENMIIRGFPETKEETIWGIMSKISSELKFPLKIEDISVGYRLAVKTSNDLRPLLIKFARRTVRDGWFQAFKVAARADDGGPGLSAQRMNSEFSGRITISDHLAPATASLLKSTKERAYQINYRFVWTNRGTIFVKRNEGERAVKILTIDDLKKLKE